MYKYKLTVFTPTFNRGYIIENLYKSLQKQTYKDFEWIVVDDGSNDTTEEIFNKWIKENNEFTITYQKVCNGGKHRAINKGLEIAKGELFFIVDSDDYLTSSSLERIVYWENSLYNKKEFAGVAGIRGYSVTEIIGETFNGEYIDATSLERDKYDLHGDKAEVFYTEILKKYPFPEFDGEKFLTERIVWDKMAYDGYKLRWFNEIVYICNYLDDGLSSSVKKMFINNPKGYALDITTQIEFRSIKFRGKIALWGEYYNNMKHENISFKQIAENLNINQFKLLLVVWLWVSKKLIKGIIK